MTMPHQQKPSDKKTGAFAGVVRQALAVAVVLFAFAAGYGVEIETHALSCRAQTILATPVVVTPSYCASSCNVAAPVPLPCEITGTATIVRNIIYKPFETQIKKQADVLEKWMQKNADGMVQAALEKINMVEENMIMWWDTMWDYNLRPGLQSMTRQVNTDAVEQIVNTSNIQDAEQIAETKKTVAIKEAETKQELAIADNGCAVATVSGGLGSATALSKAMRKGFQNRAAHRGSNRRGSPGASGTTAVLKEQADTFESTFCDPNDNGGENLCGTTAKPEFYNADTKVTEMLYNKLTIPVTDDNYLATTEAILDNMVGTAAAEVIPNSVMKTSSGQERWMNRRSYLARHAAVSSVPNALIGWRMPGAGPQLANWVKELRAGSGSIPMVAQSELSENPSYREVMHALTVDRFNSAEYAGSLTASSTALEMEKLTLSTFYLMMLRDYYDLLERTALTLAVDLSVRADIQSTRMARPKQDVSKGGK